MMAKEEPTSTHEGEGLPGKPILPLGIGLYLYKLGRAVPLLLPTTPLCLLFPGSHQKGTSNAIGASL